MYLEFLENKELYVIITVYIKKILFKPKNSYSSIFILYKFFVTN